MFERAPGLNFHDFGLCGCAAAQFHSVSMTRRAYSRIGFRVIRGQGELVATQKVYDKYVNFRYIFDHSSESVNSNELSVFFPDRLLIDLIYFTKRDSIL